jgi:PAS domain S-box-containing protein
MTRTMQGTEEAPPPLASPDRGGSRLRQTGIDAVGEAPWGTHFCQFYATKEDLIEILVPYFRAGLEGGEYCMWVTSPPLGVADAWEALAKAVPDLEAYRARRRIEIIPHTEWYLLGGRFDQERVLQGWVSRLDDALARGCTGLRLTGNTFWLEKADWRSFAEYEAAVDGVLARYRMLALCTYSVDRCGASELADVIRNHEFALIKRDGRWELFESFDRRRIQDDLAHERERLAVTLESIGDGVIATDTEGRVTTLNPVAEALTGWSQADARGRPIGEVFRIVSEQTGASVASPVQLVLERGTTVNLANHVALVRRDGTHVSIADSAAPIRGRGGATLGVVLVFRDVTGERRSERALREAEQRVRLKLESILSPEGDIGRLELSDVVDAAALQALMDELHKLTGIPMAVIDLAGKVLVGVGWQDICTKFHRVHPETCKHCIESDTQLTAKVPPGEIRLYKCKNNMWDVATPLLVGGHHVGNVFTGQFFFDDERPDRALFEAQAARYGFDRDGYLAALDAVPRLSRSTVDAGMSFLLGLTGMLSKLSYSNVKLARSGSERERLLESLRQSKDRLEDADKRKNEFLAVLSHELRNPLSPIRNSIYLLERAAPGSEQAVRAREVLRRQTEHLTRIVDDLLDVTRISRGKIDLQRGRVDLREIVRRTCDDRRSEFDGSGVVLRVEHHAGPLWVDADPTRIAQVVGNLLHNAVKFTPAGGTVAVSLAARQGRAELSVRDDGIGMDPAQVERMFEPFAQADHGLARSSGGLGLGLALVRALVELHGGSVRARSEGVGRGAEFVVSLPFTPARAAAEERPRAASRASSRAVLVIEDNVDAGQTLAEILELQGHRVRIARDGRSGVALARELRPDVVLCDIGLPDLDGYEVARTLRADESLRGTRLVALSGYAQPEDRDRARQAGFDAHVAKPPDTDELMDVVANAR